MQSLRSSNLTPLTYKHASPSLSLLIGIIAFIVYGSLFPFNFQPAPDSFDRLFVDLDPFMHRSDAIDNFLLFIPLGLAQFFCFRSPGQRLLWALILWFALGVLLQVAQLYLPGRVASLIDSFWNAIGMGFGMIAGYFLQPWFAQQRFFMGQTQDRFALLLLLAWFIYECFPFIPTLDVNELREHVKSLVIAPTFEWLRLLRHSLAAALGTIALLQVWIISKRWLMIVTTFSILFFFEVFVTYGELRRETLLGIVIGILVGERLEAVLRNNTRYAVLTLGIIAYLITIFTPFRAQPADGGFTWTPFATVLWFGNTKIVPPIAFETLAIGSLLWAGMSERLFRSSWFWPALMFCLFLILEWSRVNIIGYRGDTTTLTLLMILLPAAIIWHQDASYISAPAGKVAMMTTADKFFAVGRVDHLHKIWFHLLCTISALTLSLWLFIQLPGIPYNVQELFGGQQLIDSFFFALALLWLGFGPWWCTHFAGKKKIALLWLPFLLLLATGISLVLLKLSVTNESLDDITGSTDMYRRIVMDQAWGSHWQAQLAQWPAAPFNMLERCIRFSALYFIFLIPLSFCTIIASRRWSINNMAAALALLFPLWWLAKAIVVNWAITDNLVELIADGGVPYLALLSILLAAHTTQAAMLRYGRILWFVGSTVIFLPLSWWLVNQGLEKIVIKYDNIFSPLQFLLGANRQQWISTAELMLRWSLVYLGIITVIASGMRFACRLYPVGHRTRIISTLQTSSFAKK